MAHALDQSLVQKQSLSQRQRGALEILQLPRTELDARLDEELAANPLLEEIPPETVPEFVENTGTRDEDDDATLDERLADSDEWHGDLPLPAEREDVPDPWNGIAAPPPSLVEELNRELAAARVDEKTRALASAVIESLDDRGYLGTPLADVAMSCDADLAEAEKALRFVQTLEPAGVAARDLGECLKLQLERRGQWNGVARKLIENDLEKVGKLPLPRLAQEIGETPDAVRRAIDTLRKLDPAPAGAGRRAAVVEPDLEIFRADDGTFDAKLLRERERRFNLSERYRKWLDDPALPGEDRAFIREKSRAALDVIKALEMRGSTLLRLGRWIARMQTAFFTEGEEKLLPLTMKQAGEALELHETTVSRAVSGKYARTPQGTLPLRFFFGAGLPSGEESGGLAGRAIMEKIRKMIASEDPRRPLSDDALARKLSAEGVSIARRTVAKYRDKMHIPPSSLRVLR